MKKILVIFSTLFLLIVSGGAQEVQASSLSEEDIPTQSIEQIEPFAIYRPWKIWETVDIPRTTPTVTKFLTIHKHGTTYQGNLTLTKGYYPPGQLRYEGWMYDINQNGGYIPLVIHPIELE
jgi:hypothetical protein